MVGFVVQREKNRRHYLRARITLPFRQRPLDAAQAQVRLLAVSADPRLSEEERPGRANEQDVAPEDEWLLARLERLEGKVDRILEMLGAMAAVAPSGRAPTNSGLLPTELELSAGGLSFPAAGPVPRGSYVDVVLVLPTEGGRRVEAVLEVLRCASEPGGALPLRVAGRYAAIRETDRSAILRLLFERQRLERSGHP